MPGRRAKSLIVLSLLLAASGCDEEEPLPRLATLTELQLTDQHGEPFDEQDLTGSVWIADFIFTSCPTYCPTLTRKLSEVRRRLSDHRGEVRFLSVSVDPDNDQPEVLREYARQHDVAHDDWVFLTGRTDQVTRVVVDGFKAPMGEPQPTGDGDEYTILHARHYVLLDGDRRIRGYYRAEADQLERLIEDAKRLVEDGGRAR